MYTADNDAPLQAHIQPDGRPVAPAWVYHADGCSSRGHRSSVGVMLTAFTVVAMCIATTYASIMYYRGDIELVTTVRSEVPVPVVAAHASNGTCEFFVVGVGTRERVLVPGSGEATITDVVAGSTIECTLPCCTAIRIGGNVQSGNVVQWIPLLAQTVLYARHDTFEDTWTVAGIGTGSTTEGQVRLHWWVLSATYEAKWPIGRVLGFIGTTVSCVYVASKTITGIMERLNDYFEHMHEFDESTGSEVAIATLLRSVST